MTAETTFTLPTPDGKKIYGILNACGDTPAERAVVISHSLAGYPYEASYYMARNFLMAQGYDVYRVLYYSGATDARNLVDCTLKIHAADLNQVCDFVRPRHQKLFVIGHSYGGLTILFANPAATAFSFWDSSFDPSTSFWNTDAEKLPGTPYYKLNWGTDFLVGSAMVDEAQAITPASSAALAQKIRPPSQVVLAEDTIEAQAPTALYDALTCPKELVKIQGADHNFSRDNTLQTLLEKTGAWFDRY